MIARRMTRILVVWLGTVVIFGAPCAHAQTLDELQRPLLEKNHATVDVDYGEFAFERGVSTVGQSYTYFEPAYQSIVPRIGFGITKRIQFTVNGAYLPPVYRPYAIGGDRPSVLDSRLMVRSLRADLVMRPTDDAEISVAYLSGRSRYNASFPYGNGTASLEHQATEILQVRAIWLPRADEASRPLRADLDGLTRPLLRRHRSSITWDAVWRRHRGTVNERTPGYLGERDEDVRATDTRVGVGVGLGVTDRLQLTADGYWQPPFTMTDRVTVSRSAMFENDYSVRFTDVSGWRAGVRWRPVQHVELFGSVKDERQFVRLAFSELAGSTFRQTGMDAGLTWLSRAPHGAVPWQADVSGLHRPFLEKLQLRMDAVVTLRSYEDDDWHAHSIMWRARVTAGMLSSLQAAFYVGRFVDRGDTVEHGRSLGAELRVRPTRRLEAYGTFDYHPRTWLDRYPAFILNRGSYRSFRDFADTAYRDSASVHGGLRIVL